jgi:hypothetical protein
MAVSAEPVPEWVITRSASRMAFLSSSCGSFSTALMGRSLTSVPENVEALEQRNQLVEEAAEVVGLGCSHGDDDLLDLNVRRRRGGRVGVEDRPAVLPPVGGPGGVLRVGVHLLVERDDLAAERRAVGARGALDVVGADAAAGGDRQEREREVGAGADGRLVFGLGQHLLGDLEVGVGASQVTRFGVAREDDFAAGEQSPAEPGVERHPVLIFRRDADSRCQSEQLLEVSPTRADKQMLSHDHNPR